MHASSFSLDFYLQPTTTVARQLLGAVIERELPDGQILRGRIVETEAYGQADPACHSVRELPDGSTEHRRTARNTSMFGPPGRAYVYFTYGNQFMLNIVTQPEGVPEAVLIRALQPLDGLPEMMARRGTANPRALLSGPGKLCQALCINRELNGHDLTLAPLTLIPATSLADADIITTTRIGITHAADLPWRYYERDSVWISRK